MVEKKRSELLEVAGIEGRMLCTAEVAVINISLGGALIEAEKRLDIDEEYSLSITDSGEEIELRGRVIWSKIRSSRKTPEGEVVPVYHAGINFSNVLLGRARELLDFIEGHSPLAYGRVTGNRFSIEGVQKAYLHYPMAYTVRKLGTEGILMVSEQRLLPDKMVPMEICLGDGQTVMFQGRVASCIPLQDSDPIMYEVEVGFDDMPEEGMEKIWGHINSQR